MSSPLEVFAARMNLKEHRRTFTQAQVETLFSAPLSFLDGAPGFLIRPILFSCRYTLNVAYANTAAPSLRFDALPASDLVIAGGMNYNGAPALKYNLSIFNGASSFAGAELIGSGLFLRQNVDLTPGGVMSLVQFHLLYALISF